MIFKLLTEKLNTLRNEMTHLWSGLFITGGSSITLFLNGKSIFTYLFALLGAVLAVIFLNAYLLRRTEVKKILKTMENEL